PGGALSPRGGCAGVADLVGAARDTDRGGAHTVGARPELDPGSVRRPHRVVLRDARAGDRGYRPDLLDLLPARARRARPRRRRIRWWRPGGSGSGGGRRGPQHYGFYQLMTLFTVSMLGLVLTDSLILLFICWEL